MVKKVGPSVGPLQTPPGLEIPGCPLVPGIYLSRKIQLPVIHPWVERHVIFSIWLFSFKKYYPFDPLANKVPKNWHVCIQMSMQVSSNNILQSTGSSRRPGVSASHEPGDEPEPSHGRTTDASPSALRRLTSTGRRSSPVVSSDHKRANNIKNFESTLKGIEGLHF